MRGGRAPIASCCYTRGREGRRRRIPAITSSSSSDRCLIEHSRKRNVKKEKEMMRSVSQSVGDQKLAELALTIAIARLREKKESSWLALIIGTLDNCRIIHLWQAGRLLLRQ